MELQLDRQGALYEQIARAEACDFGRADPLRKPAALSCALARALQVSRKSIIQAYDLLCAEQLAVARVGSGTRVAKISAPAVKRVSALRKPTSAYVARMRKLGEITLGTRTNHRYNLQYGDRCSIRISQLMATQARRRGAACRADMITAGGFMPLRRVAATIWAAAEVRPGDPPTF